MFTLRRRSAFIFIIAIFIATISGCAAKKEEASYEERRHMPLSGELSMEEMEYTENIDGTEEVGETVFLIHRTVCRFPSVRTTDMNRQKCRYREKRMTFPLQATVRRERSRLKYA